MLFAQKLPAHLSGLTYAEAHFMGDPAAADVEDVFMRKKSFWLSHSSAI